ncbi:unnamed protein product [Linum trigynum]|uniref:Uncharacterized protein n=1 Tax=Linum trigynum TaxID=586398 RepID=A0AAV2GUV6_9ROSI
MAAAAAAGSGVNNKNFHLNVVAIVTTATGPNGAPVTREAERVFTLPLEPMLNEDSAMPYVRKVVESFLPMKIPDPEENVAIVDKVADVALRLFVALEGDEIDKNKNNNKAAAAEAGSGSGSGAASLGLERRWFYAKDGLPMTKVTIYVAHDGFVSVVGDFELDDDEDDTDSDDEDDDEEEEEEDGGVEAMETK